MSPDPNLPCSEYKILDTATTDGALAAKAVKMNVVAMCNFTMAFTTEALIGVIYASMTDEWPTGKANTVVMLLHEKFVPKDLVSKIELRRQLNGISIQPWPDDADPDGNMMTVTSNETAEQIEEQEQQTNDESES
eukprot:10396624-Ditylum_brightwellii.AAC.1